MIMIVFIIIIFIYIMMNIALARIYAKRWKNHKKKVYFIMILLMLMSLLTMLIQSKSVGSLVGFIGSYWLAVSFLAFFIFLVFSIIPLQTFRLSNTVLVVLLIVGIWQAHQIKLTEYDVTLKKEIEPMRIALISDIHLGYVNGARKLDHIVDQINELNADAIFIAGDLFDGNFKAVRQLDRIRDSLNRLQSTHGTYLAWGNHDAGNHFRQMKEFISSTDVVLLEDDVFDASSFVVVGRRDISPIGSQGNARQSVEHLLELVDEEKPLFVIDHQPSMIDEYDERFDLIVSGHTHEGQIFPFNYVTKSLFPIDYGKMRRPNGPNVIVTSGAGFWGPPIRLGTKSEIVIIDIK